MASVKTKRLDDPKSIPVKLDKPLLDRIEALAARMGEAKSTVMRIAMRVGLDQLEKIFTAAPGPMPPEAVAALGKSSNSRYPSHDPQLNEVRETAAAAAPPPATKKKRAA